jgi:hypothetical protein
MAASSPRLRPHRSSPVRSRRRLRGRFKSQAHAIPMANATARGFAGTRRKEHHVGKVEGRRDQFRRNPSLPHLSIQTTRSTTVSITQTSVPSWSTGSCRRLEAGPVQRRQWHPHPPVLLRRPHRHRPRQGDLLEVLAGVACLGTALERQEPWGVWGGQLLVNGSIVAQAQTGTTTKHPGPIRWWTRPYPLHQMA